MAIRNYGGVMTDFRREVLLKCTLNFEKYDALEISEFTENSYNTDVKIYLMGSICAVNELLSNIESLQKEIAELKIKLRAELMEGQEPSDKSQEASHYNYLDDKNADLKAQLKIAKEALKEIEDRCYNDDSRAWSVANDALEKLETKGEW